MHPLLLSSTVLLWPFLFLAFFSPCISPPQYFIFLSKCFSFFLLYSFTFLIFSFCQITTAKENLQAKDLLSETKQAIVNIILHSLHLRIAGFYKCVVTNLCTFNSVFLTVRTHNHVGVMPEQK